MHAVLVHRPVCLLLFFFHDTATTEIYTLSLHDALPICSAGRSRRTGCWPGRPAGRAACSAAPGRAARRAGAPSASTRDRKSTRLNSSHLGISYAVFCLKKKKKKQDNVYTSQVMTDNQNT